MAAYQLKCCILFCLAFGIVFPSVAQNDKSIPKISLDLDASSARGNPRNSEGDFITLNDGSIMFVYSHFTGNSSSDFASSRLSARFSYDSGNTWTKEDRIILENEARMNTSSVSLLRLTNNEIALFYLRANSVADCIPYVRFSSDEGKTWGDAIKCITDVPGYYTVNNSRVIQTKKGRLLMPVSLHSGTKTVREGATEEELVAALTISGRLFCYYSDDRGRTWKRSAQVPFPEGIIAQEPGLIELENRSILMYIRTDAGMQYASYSKDNGKTWSVAGPSNIPSPVSPATIARIPGTGDLVLIWNNNGVMGTRKGNQRNPFNLAVSDNEGLSWKHIKTLHDDPNWAFHYTAARFTPDGQLLLGYSAGGWGHLYIRKIGLEWIYDKEKTP